jgi:hypothetical protein
MCTGVLSNNLNFIIEVSIFSTDATHQASFQYLILSFFNEAYSISDGAAFGVGSSIFSNVRWRLRM